jgi:hypothetical protein
MRSRILFFVLAVALPAGVPRATFADSNHTCPVTKAPDPPFTPPERWKPESPGDGGYFLFGTTGLWALVHNHWRLHLDGTKLPYFSEHYEWKNEPDPRMVVLARRLDAPAELVWADWVNGAGPSHRFSEPIDPTKPGSMVTSLQVPTAGCWEITARYAPVRGKVEILSYTVLVEP